MQLNGVVASKGTKNLVEGVAYFQNTNKLNKNSILIIKETNVDLKQIMKKCTGIITEKGGLLSLTAIFSREFKIPCIVGVKNISKYVKPDDKLVFNLKTGTILKKE